MRRRRVLSFEQTRYSESSSSESLFSSFLFVIDLFSLPDSLSFTSGAILEPLCVVLQGFSRSSLKGNERVLVIGAGAVGLLTCE